MENYHVWINRVLCCLCSLVYFISGIATADELVCNAIGISAPVAAPTCGGLDKSGKWKLDPYTPPAANSASTWFCTGTAGQFNGYRTAGGGCGWQKTSCDAGVEPPGRDDSGKKPFWVALGKMGGNSACLENGCTATGVPDGQIGVGTGGGAVTYYTFFQDMKQTGATCVYDDNQGSGPDVKCGPDEGTATVNGKTTCLAKGEPNPKDNPKPKTDTTKKETNNSDGTKTTTETTTTTQKNGDGTTTTTTTTTTTKRGADGTVLGTETSTETKKTDPGNKDDGDDDEEDKMKDFCEKNPHLNICKNSTVAGACETTTCEGDAITCAVLKLQRATDCEVKKDTAEKTLGKQLNDKNDPLKSSLPSIDNARQVDLGALNINSNGWGLGGACIQNKSITVMGKTVIIPLSELCEYLLALRYGIMLIAGILSFKIVSGAVLTV